MTREIDGDEFPSIEDQWKWWINGKKQMENNEWRMLILRRGTNEVFDTMKVPRWWNTLRLPDNEMPKFYWSNLLFFFVKDK